MSQKYFHAIFNNVKKMPHSPRWFFRLLLGAEDGLPVKIFLISQF